MLWPHKSHTRKTNTMNAISIGEQVVAGLIVLFVSIGINWTLNRKWTKRNILNLIREDKNVQNYLRNLSSGLRDKKILVLQEPGDNNLIDTLKEIPLFQNLQITEGNHHNIERISSNDLTIISTRVLQAASNRDRTFTEIMTKKTSDKALIFFAPHGEESLDLEKKEFEDINARSLTTVTRASGRLANDVLSLLTFLA